MSVDGKDLFDEPNMHDAFCLQSGRHIEIYVYNFEFCIPRRVAPPNGRT